MKIGAQLYSVRTLAQTEEQLDNTMKALKEMGYDTVQLSGLGPIPVEKIVEISKKYDLPITGTHYPYDRIINDTDAVIAEHKAMGSNYCGLGAPNPEFRGSLANFQKLIDSLEEPVKKLEAAGIHFTYHNHWFEFEKMPDGEILPYDYLLEKCPNWMFILDTYWVTYAGYSPIEYLKKVGNRLAPVHYKDLTYVDGKKTICHCGAGEIDFTQVTKVCNELGVTEIYVEQDNAVSFENPLDEMKKSFEFLKPIIA